MSVVRALFLVALLAVLTACGGEEKTEATKVTASLLGSAIDETVIDETVIDETVIDETVIDETVADETVIDETVADDAEPAEGLREVVGTLDRPVAVPVGGADKGPPESQDSAESDGPGGAIEIDGDSVAIDWSALSVPAYFAPADGGDDPFFHIHTHPEDDGFFLSFEMFTAWAQGWVGGLGTVDISCLNPESGTGICAYFDPDGPGPKPVLGDDFGATGSMTISKLDDDGYQILVHELLFTDGTSFEEFAMLG